MQIIKYKEIKTKICFTNSGSVGSAHVVAIEILIQFFSQLKTRADYVLCVAIGVHSHRTALFIVEQIKQNIDPLVALTFKPYMSAKSEL